MERTKSLRTRFRKAKTESLTPRPSPGQPNTYEQDMRKRIRNNIRASQ